MLTELDCEPSLREPALVAQQCPRTLVVDDLPDAAHTFAALLKSLGCETTAITDPLIAVDTMERIQA